MKRAQFIAFSAALITQAFSVAAQQQPTFRSGVEVTAIDVTVVDNDGRPIVDVAAGEFHVKIDGRDRKVVSAQWIGLSAPTGRAATSTANSKEAPLRAAPGPEGYSSNEDVGRGRLIVLAIDQPNLKSDGAASLRGALNGFVDALEPGDRVAAVALGGGPSTAFTADRAAVKAALSRMSGEMRPVSEFTRYAIGLGEARAISQGDTAALDSVVNHECIEGSGLVRASDGFNACVASISNASFSIATARRNEADQTMRSLRSLFDALQKVDGPKAVVLVTEGFVGEDEQPSIVDLGSFAANAQTSIYVLKIDSDALDMSIGRNSPNGILGVTSRDGDVQIQSAAASLGFKMTDREIRYSGVELLASVAKGDVFNVIGTGRPAVERIGRELSGYYLLGVESEPADTDGKAHTIGVQISRRGAIVRSRRELAHSSAAKAGALTPKDEVAAALSSPLMAAGLPLRVATFAMRDPKDARVQVLIHADVGTDYTAAKAVTLGYAVIDGKGEIVVDQIGAGRLPPAVSGAPAPLTYSTSVTLDPGDYTLKLAIVEGDRLGSVEHGFKAGYIDAGSLKLSELMIGGPIDARLILAPTVGYDVRYGTVQGYIEAYGPSSKALTVKYEIAPDVNAPSLFSAVVPGRTEGDDRTVFSYAMPVRDLKPGKYFLRASFSSSGTPVKTLARGFRVEPAPPPASTGTAAAGTARSIAVSVNDDLLAKRFQREEVTRAETVQRFRETLPAAAAAAFDAGATALRGGDDVSAEARFRSALEAVPAGADNTAALAYLGASYAATGRDSEAVSIWQIAMVDGSGFPQLYDWISSALLRLGKPDDARLILEEALTKWPAETGFAKPLALMFAKGGRAREAVALLEHYLGDHPNDLDALYTGVQWIAEVHTAGALVHTQQDDLRIAQGWADAYTLANGPRADDVKRWLISLQPPPTPLRF